MSDEWPKPWGAITPDTDGSPLKVIGSSWVDLGPVRIYDGTVYVNPDGAWEGENRDRWLPLGRYLAGERTE